MADAPVTVAVPALTAYIVGNVLDRTNGRERKETNTGHCFAAIDIERFRPLGDFTAAMDDMLQALHDTPRADGQERVYTAGEPEAHAWPLARGASALEAAGRIHSDIARGFIRAEVMGYEDFAALRSDAKVREAGKLRLEGKEYVIRDGDIIHVRFKV